MSSTREVERDDSGIGGDEPFCAHGNLLWSEDCDQCAEESRALSNAITAAIRRDSEAQEGEQP